MRKLFAAFVLVMLSSSCFSATIKFFTDYPNAVPVGSDFFVFQRNQSYINATVSQTKSDWFNNPSFTGNGAISGAFGVGGFFVANGIMYGNGAGLTNVLTLTTNVSFTFITNNIEYTTNLFVTTNFVNTSFTTNLFVDNSITTNLFVTQEFVTNIVAGTITNNTFVTTNVFVDNSVTINSNLTVQTITNNTFFSTNTTIENITNVNLYSTNITVQNITNNTFVTTNVTINQPGGFTNLNLVPNSLMYSDINDSEASLPNGTGVLTNNGSGGMGWTLSLSLTEIDAQNFYPTNMFTGLTNYGTLGTDANGLLTIGSGTITNINITNAFIQNLTNNTFVNTNLAIFIGDTRIKNLTVTNLTVVSGLTNLSLNASQFVVTDANKAETTTLDGSTLTNLTYRYITNNTGNTTLNWSTAYRTNIAADVTLSLQSVSAAPNAQFYETIVYWVTNSSASNFKTTWPSGVIGPVGSGTPAVLYCTNKTLTRILVEHYGPSDITVSKTDFGN